MESALDQEQPEALLVGGQALLAYGVVRQTLDIDCLAAPAGAAKLQRVLLAAGYTVAGESASVVRYRHDSPLLLDVDVLLVNPATYAPLLRDSRPWRSGSIAWRVPALPHLIAMKLHAMKHNPRRLGHDLADCQPAPGKPGRGEPRRFAAIEHRVRSTGDRGGVGEIWAMEQLTLPVFKMPEVPSKPVPPAVLHALNADLVKRLKESGEYDRWWSSPTREPAPVRFRLN